MAETLVLKSRKVTREKLATFLNNQELIKAFENMQSDLQESVVESINAIFLALQDLTDAPDQVLSNLADLATVFAIARDVETQTLSSQLSSLRAEVSALQTQLNDFTQGICP